MKFKEFIINFSIMLAVVVLFFFAFEILLRNATINPQLLAKPNINVQMNTSEYNITISTNRIGARDNEHSFLKNEYTYRIVVIGDSFVLGSGINAEDGFQKVLERKLNNDNNNNIKTKNKTVEIISLGNTGYGPVQYEQLLKTYGLKYDPDLIIISYFAGNDITDVKNPYVKESKIKYAIKNFARKIYVFNYVIKLASQSNAPIAKFPIDVEHLSVMAMQEGISKEELQRRINAVDPILLEEVNNGSINAHELKNAIIHPQITHDVIFLDNTKIMYSWKETQRYLQQINELAKNENIAVVFMTIPPSIQVDKKYQKYPAKIGYNISEEMLKTTITQDAFVAFAKQNNVNYVDLLPLMREHKNESLYYLKDGHFTPLGHELIAEYLIMKLEEIKLLPSFEEQKSSN